jgi:hypothetical protein
MSTIDLLDKDEECEGMWHDKVGNPKCFVWNIGKNLEIDPITPSNDEYEIFTLISTIFDHISKVTSTHPFSTFIEEYDRSIKFYEGFLNEKSFLNFYIFWIRMGNRLEWF